jgi:hypothetical protein
MGLGLCLGQVQGKVQSQVRVRVRLRLRVSGQGQGQGVVTVDAVGGEDEVAISQLGALLGAPGKRVNSGRASSSGRSAPRVVARGVAVSGRLCLLFCGV